MPYELQLLGDIHLEIKEDDCLQYKSDFRPGARDLALLGNIGWTRDTHLFEWLDAQRAQFKTIFYVLGDLQNHNPSLGERIQELDKCPEKCQGSTESNKGKFILLNQTVYEIPDSTLTIIGCTLWPEPKQEQFQKDSLENERNDSETNTTQPISDINWLRTTIQAIRDTKPDRHVIILTHHPPASVGSIELKEDSSKETLLKAPVVAWAFGRTKWIDKDEKGGVQVYSNQQGENKYVTEYSTTTVLKEEDILPRR